MLKLSIFGDINLFANLECKMFVDREQQTMWGADSIDFSGILFGDVAKFKLMNPVLIDILENQLHSRPPTRVAGSQNRQEHYGRSEAQRFSTNNEHTHTNPTLLLILCAHILPQSGAPKTIF